MSGHDWKKNPRFDHTDPSDFKTPRWTCSKCGWVSYSRTTPNPGSTLSIYNTKTRTDFPPLSCEQYIVYQIENI